MFFTRQIYRGLIKGNIRNCHHDRELRLPEYHIIGLHQNLTKLVGEITQLNKTVNTLQTKIDNLETLLTKTHKVDPKTNWGIYL